MPLSLLLTQQLTVLTAGVRKLDRWEPLTDTFALVGRRMRSAFLVGWFGTALPVEGIDLRVVLANLDELAARWSLVTRGGRQQSGGGPNLVEPLLGATGMLAGALAAPLNGMVAAVILDSRMRGFWQKLFTALVWLSAGTLLSAVLLVAAPVGALGAVPWAISGQASDWYAVLGGVAALALPASRLWAQLSGREPIRNPLTRGLVALADRIAALVAQLLGAVAVAVTRIAPQLTPAVDAARATLHATGELVAAISLVAVGTMDAVAGMLSGPQSLPAIARGVVAALLGLTRRLGRIVVTGAFTLLRGVLGRFTGAPLHALVRFAFAAAGFVRQVLVEHPTVRWLLSLAGIAAAMRAWSARRPAAPAPTSGGSSSPPSKWVTSFPMPASTRRFLKLATTRPGVPSLSVQRPPLLGPGLVGPVAEAIRAGLLAAPADPFALEPGQRAALQRFRRPPSVLGGLAAELAEHRKQADADGASFALADVIGGLTPLLSRDAASMMPQQAGAFLPRIATLLDRIDTELRGTSRPHPTRDLPEPAEVRPVVGRLLVRTGAGPDAGPGLRRFVTDLRRELDARDYPAPAAAGARR